MSFPAFILILASVLLHAGWHFISKSQRPAMAFFLLISFGGLMTALPFALASGVSLSGLPGRFWIWLAIGAVSGSICNIGLSFAYRLSEVSLAYPMARALPVLFTAGIMGLVGRFIGAGVTPLGWLGSTGMVVIFFGCLIMPQDRLDGIHPRKLLRDRAFPWILMAAIGTTGYTITDKFGVDLMIRYGGGRNTFLSTCAYAAIRESILFLFLLNNVNIFPHERMHLNRDMLKHWLGYVAGVMATSAYILVLLAMHFVTNVSYVQAFRQMSLPAGAFLGIIILKEKASVPKFVGLALIVAGLVATALC